MALRAQGAQTDTLTASLALKADQSALDTLTTTVGTKASSVTVTALIASDALKAPLAVCGPGGMKSGWAILILADALLLSVTWILWQGSSVLAQSAVCRPAEHKTPGRCP